MKAVEAQDAWRAITKGRGFRVARLGSVGKRPLADFDAELPNGLTIVCGLNGVGKTTLLRLVLNALGGPASTLREDLLQNGTFEVILEVDDVECGTPLTDEHSVAVTLLDAASECAHLLALSRQPNFEDLAEGFDPHEWTDAELTEARYVLGKSYTAIRVTEIDDPGPVPSASHGDQADGLGDIDATMSVAAANGGGNAEQDDAVLPLIDVEDGGVSYDFRHMGLGELAALVFLWRLRRVRPNTVVLLEEPETYLSARSTIALLDVLAKTVTTRRLYALVTTHSPGLITGAPLTAVRVMASANGVTLLREPSSAAELELMLGLPSGAARVVLVEDHTAHAFLMELIGRYGGAWARTLTYLRTGGDETLMTLCKKFPRTDRLHIVGVLDGDQPVPNKQPTWPVLGLPGPGNPDALLRSAILAAVATFADRSGRTTDDVSAAFEAHAGIDEHDWFHEVAKSLGMDIHGVRRIAVGMWLDDSGNASEADKLVQAVLSAIART